jgi:hypothetical protein
MIPGMDADGSNAPRPEVHLALVAAFGVFRRPQHPGDLEDGVSPGPPMVMRLGLLAAEVRRVSVTPALCAWVTPGSGGAALSQRSRDRHGGFSTGTWGGPVEAVALRGLFGWSISLTGAETYYGLVPDGNEIVRMTLIDGTRSTARVVENVFIAQPGRSVSTIQFRDADGNPDTRSTGIHLDA